ncbi:MAG: ankyrin repeat domain-containing protein [Proteobacteria bacterium]|nr:ankyrin repeat domain-containing protein [Pseudomonadota bacterium]
MRRCLFLALFAMFVVLGCAGSSREVQTPASTSAGSAVSGTSGSVMSDDVSTINGELLPPLHAACNSSHIDKDLIRKLADEGADVNEEVPIDKSGAIRLSPLMIACDRSDIDVEAVKLLIELGANVNESAGREGFYVPEEQERYRGKTALMIASNRSVIDKDAIRVLVSAGADLNARSSDDYKDMSALMLACNRSEIDDEAIKLMIELGADVNLGNNNNDNSVMIATDRIHADIQASKILLDAGINVNQVAKNSTVLLMGGGVLNSLELTKKIVAMGADIHYVDRDGMSLLGYAAAFGSEDVVQYYIDNGLDVNHVRDDGQPVVMQAAWGNTLDVVKMLVKAGADLSIKADDGWTNLISACNPKSDNVNYQRIDRPQLDVAQYLIDSGASVREKSSDGRTALTVLVKNRNDVTDLVKLLVSNGADVNHRTPKGVTPLMWANHPNVIKYLLDKGADINAVDHKQWTALHWAIRNNRLEAAQVLLDAGIDRNAKDTDGDDVRGVAYSAEAIEFLYKNGYRFNDVWTNIDDYYHVLNNAEHDFNMSNRLLTMLMVGGGSDNPRIGSEIISYISHSDIVPIQIDEIIDEIVRRNPNVLNEPAEYGVNHLTEIMMHRPDSWFSAILIKHGAKIQTRQGESPFAVVFRTASPSTAVVKALIASGEDVNVTIKGFLDKPVPVLKMIARFAPGALKDALEAGADPNVTDEDGFTPLMSVRYVEAALELLHAGANPNARLNNGKSVLMMYAESGDSEIVKALLDAGAVVDIETMAYADNAEIASLLRNHMSDGHYTLENLLYMDEVTEDMIKDVIAGGYDLNKPLDENNQTLLTFACRSGQGGKIKLLLKYGADPNIPAKNDFGMTPFMLAVSKWMSPNTMDIETIRALIKAGAKINSQDESGMTPLMHATEMPHGEKLGSDIVRLLIESGADAKMSDIDGRNVLSHLSYDLEPEIVKLLLKKGVDAKQKNEDGSTPLMFQCNPEIMKLLIDAGADVNAKNKEGKTALIALPEFCHYSETYEHLVKAGADINAKDRDGRNALYYAVHNRHFEVIEYLARSGIDVNAKDKDGKTVIETLKPSPTTPRLVHMLQSSGAAGTPQPGWDEVIHYKW